MALSKEDKKDVGSKLGKALANKVETATKDYGASSKSKALAKKAGNKEYTGKASEYSRPKGGSANFMKVHKLDR